MPRDDKPHLETEAREHLAGRSAQAQALSLLSPAELVAELQVYQAELEVQSQELESARAHYFVLFDLSPIAYILLNAKREVVEVNLAARDLFQADSALKTDFYRRHLSEQSRVIFSRHLDYTFSSPASRPIELQIRTGRSETREVMVHTRLLASTAADSVRCLCAFIDVSWERSAARELRASEAAMRAARDLQEAVFEALPAHVALLDEIGTILSVNAAWRNFATENGLKTARAGIGANYVQICMHARDQGSADAGAVARALQAVLAGQLTDFSLEYSAHSATEQRWFLLSLTPIRSEHLRGAVVMHTNITAKKRLETQFIRAQRLQSIGALAGGIAHDLNNVLTPIVMGMELLRMRTTNAAEAETIETIQTAARRGSAVTQQLLSFARGLDDRRIAFKPALLLDQIERIVTETFPRNIQLQMHAERDGAPVVGDPGQLQQVLLNLCVNARDAMPDGGSLGLELKDVVLNSQTALPGGRSRPGSFVRFRVRDTGRGMSREALDRAFDPALAVPDFSDGATLGLSTARTIVENHGGFIDYVSAVGNGSTFDVYLPAHRAKDTTPDAGVREELPQGRGETVLVVDDEISVRTVTQQTLEAFGYHVLTARDGGEALRLYTKEGDRVSVVLTDMMMPSMDGPATIRALRQLNPRIKIIAVSGLNCRESVTGDVAAVIDQFLPKPFTTAALLKVLHDVLQRPAG